MSYDTHSKQPSNNNLKTLQILRAVAATSVVYFHIKATPVFGSFGVDIFFVISGFVMAMVIKNGQSATSFAISRIARIVPLYWLLTTCLLFLAYIKPELLNSTTANLSNYLKSILFIPYFKENGALHPMLAVGWTLNYEMFFYFCIWLSIALARKIYIQITFILLAASYFVLGSLSSNPVLHSFFYSTLLFEFALGIIAFKLYEKNQIKKMGSFSLLAIVIISFGFMAYCETTGTNAERIFIYGIPSVTLLLSVTALENTNFIRSNKITNTLVTIGNASYATYLSHFYVVEGFRKIAFLKLDILNPYTPEGVAVILFSSLLTGHILYIALDKPLSKYFKKVLESKLTQQQL
jgi:exopolysaccharide production protein ExoZ